jgi:hypothetical protein
MDRQYVGIDFHRRRSVIVRVRAAGEKLSSVRVANDPVAIAAAVADAGPDPEVVVEATYGWYWVVDLLQANGASVHLANPQGLNWGQRRVKIRRSDVQAFVVGLDLAPSTVRVVRQHLVALFGAAVEDQLIARNPHQASGCLSARSARWYHRRRVTSQRYSRPPPHGSASPSCWAPGSGCARAR